MLVLFIFMFSRVPSTLVTSTGDVMLPVAAEVASSASTVLRVYPIYSCESRAVHIVEETHSVLKEAIV